MKQYSIMPGALRSKFRYEDVQYKNSSLYIRDNAAIYNL
jgi:hypothetical protein